LADGWNPVGMPVDGMAQMFDGVRKMAKEAGRDPDSLQMVVRANFEVQDKPRGKEGMIFTGTLDQIREDTEGCRKIGAHEVFFDPTFAPDAQSLDRWLGSMEQLRKLIS
jgi:alkanesulfonate monooxygenase SsuD/methylene tetrahydromethanopterin reductase-like flavin-dependent oxidoreductase (luciferase family)